MKPSTIQFHTSHSNIDVVIRLSEDGIWVNPEIPADEAAKQVLATLDSNIKVLVQKAVEDEREACAKECEDKKVGFPSYFEIDKRIQECADAIRARGNT